MTVNRWMCRCGSDAKVGAQQRLQAACSIVHLVFVTRVEWHFVAFRAYNFHHKCV